MSKLFFIIGIRRSLTSVLRTIIQGNSNVGSVLFEPHDLWAAVDLAHFPRLMNDGFNKGWVTQKINAFKFHGKGGMWHGAKFALNPGTKALEWRWLYETFPEAKFIFITRGVEKTWKSVFKQDHASFRGLIRVDSYMSMAGDLIRDFNQYAANNYDKACVIEADKLLKNADAEMLKVWTLLKIAPMKGINKMMKKPENG